MSYIKKLIRNLSTQERRILGRWKLENCSSKTNYKVDYANEDHCGVCSDNRFKEYALKKNNVQQEYNQEIEEYIRYMF